MKKIEVQMFLYTLTKKIMEVQGYILNPFDIILFCKVVGWFDGQNIGVELRMTRSQLLEGLKCESQTENSERARSRSMFLGL
jgi:hypothetical protein